MSRFGDLLTLQTLPHHMYAFDRLPRYKRIGSLTLLSAILFTVAFVIGFVTSTTSTFSGNLGLAMSPGTSYTTAEILLNNLGVGMLAAVFGGGILPAIAILLGNGYSIGNAIGTLFHTYGFEAFLLTPHGFFELPALFLATASGFRFSTILLTRLTVRDSRTIHHNAGIASMDFLLCLSLSTVLFVIAAVIETTYTLDVVRTLT